MNVEDSDDLQVERTVEQDRGGTTPHIVRYVLGISLALSIIAVAIISISGAQSG